MTGTFEGLGTLQFTPDNKYCWAYSGPVSTTDSGSSSLLDFTTNSEYIVGTFTPYHGAATTQNMQFTLKFNGLEIAQVSSREAYDFARANPIHIIIPPFTNVSVEALGLESGTNNTMAVIVGKVKGAVEQINLESMSDDNKWAEKGPF